MEEGDPHSLRERMHLWAPVCCTAQAHGESESQYWFGPMQATDLPCWSLPLPRASLLTLGLDKGDGQGSKSPWTCLGLQLMELVNPIPGAQWGEGITGSFLTLEPILNGEFQRLSSLSCIGWVSTGNVESHFLDSEQSHQCHF